MSDAQGQNPVGAKRRRLSPEERRAQLLETAIEVFAEVGLERAGHGEIARRAGVSTATVFNYFPTRSDLVEAVLERIETIIDVIFETVPPRPDDIEGSLTGLATAYTKMITEQPSATKTFLKWGVSFDPEIRKPWLAYQARTLDHLMTYFPNATSPRTEARILFGASNMLAIMAFDHKNPDDIQAFTRRMISVLSESQ